VDISTNVGTLLNISSDLHILNINFHLFLGTYCPQFFGTRDYTGDLEHNVHTRPQSRSVPQQCPLASFFSWPFTLLANMPQTCQATFTFITCVYTL